MLTSGFVIGPKAFKSPAELARTVLHETYRITVRPDEAIGQEYVTQETMEADEFANMSYKHLMGEAEEGTLFDDGGGGEGGGTDG